MRRVLLLRLRHGQHRPQHLQRDARPGLDPRRHLARPRPVLRLRARERQLPGCGPRPGRPPAAPRSRRRACSPPRWPGPAAARLVPAPATTAVAAAAAASSSACRAGRVSPRLCANGRAEPDISLNASIGQNIYDNGHLSGNGGTSIVAPEVSGQFAQMNAYLLSLGAVCSGPAVCPTIGDPHYDLYDSFSGRHRTTRTTTSPPGARATTSAAAGAQAPAMTWPPVWARSTRCNWPGSSILVQRRRVDRRRRCRSAARPTGGWVNGGTISWTVD